MEVGHVLLASALGSKSLVLEDIRSMRDSRTVKVRRASKLCGSSPAKCREVLGECSGRILVLRKFDVHQSV